MMQKRYEKRPTSSHNATAGLLSERYSTRSSKRSSGVGQECPSIRLRELLRSVRAARRRVEPRIANPEPPGPLPSGRPGGRCQRVLFAEYAPSGLQRGGRGEAGFCLASVAATRRLCSQRCRPGPERDAAEAHVRFNSAPRPSRAGWCDRDTSSYAAGCVSHASWKFATSEFGDFRGDIIRVANLRGGEGVSASDCRRGAETGCRNQRQPAPNVQCLGDLCFSWYAGRTRSQLSRCRSN